MVTLVLLWCVWLSGGARYPVGNHEPSPVFLGLHFRIVSVDLTRSAELINKLRPSFRSFPFRRHGIVVHVVRISNNEPLSFVVASRRGHVGRESVAVL